MLIGIDGNEANEVRSDISERVGVNQYAFEILWGLYRLVKKKKKHKAIIYLKSTPQADLPKEDSYWKYKVIPGRGLWIITKLIPHLFLTKPRPDVFFTPNHYLPPLISIPSVCTIHDLGYLEFSEQFKKHDFWQLKYWTAISITISKYIIAVSESTKREIVRHFPFASKKIVVTHHGYDKTKFNTKITTNDVRRVIKKYKISSKDYTLFLSTLKPSKNVEGLLEAFAKTSNGKIKLVIAGKKGWMYKSIFQKVKDLNLGNRVVFTDFVAESDKPALIFGAKVFVLPSYWEGFGMDVLHAMACGIPVVVSKVASLPEVAGAAGVYVNPYKLDDIAKGLAKVLDMTPYEYNRFVERGLRQVEKFSWEKTAKKTLKVLEKAGRKK